MTQDEYKTWTGETVNFSEEDWEAYISVASMRLASFLCLSELPTDDGELPEDLKMVLANFLCAILKFRGNANTQVEEKRVRNFTIRFSSSSAANAFAQIESQYADIIGKYSACESGLVVEKNAPRCYYHDSL